MAKPKFQKDWWKSTKPETSSEVRTLHLFEQMEVKTTSDLPQLISPKETAQILRMTPKTVSDLMSKQVIQSMKLRGRRFTTPEWIADFMRREQKAHG